MSSAFDTVPDQFMTEIHCYSNQDTRRMTEWVAKAKVWLSYICGARATSGCHDFVSSL